MEYQQFSTVKHVWQSHAASEHYSTAYFDYTAMFVNAVHLTSANSGGSCTLVRRYTRYSCPLAKNPLLGLGLKVKQRSKEDQRP